MVQEIFGKMRGNLWIPATFVLLIALVFAVFMKSGGTGGVVSGNVAGENMVAFINAQGGGNAEYVSAEKEDSLYKVTVNYNGEDIPIFVTLDGKYYVPNAVPLTADASASSPSAQEPAPVDVPKSDKPKVELFIMSYCPYGTQMEKGILPVVAALGGKIDFKLRYTHFTLHGDKEDKENFRQICIREEQGTKFLSYIQCTLNSSDVYEPGNVSVCMKGLGIDVAKVDSCIKSKATDYYAVDSQLSQGYGVQGSPTLVINGVQAQSSRSPAGILSLICSAFNNAPAECNVSLPTQGPSPGFGYTASATDSAASVAQC